VPVDPFTMLHCSYQQRGRSQRGRCGWRERRLVSWQRKRHSGAGAAYAVPRPGRDHHGYQWATGHTAPWRRLQRRPRLHVRGRLAPCGAAVDGENS
jgi:hypothetical protein